ncbi:MAG: hypothetical protein ABFD16_08300 [Thermoguttaceae bacterium]|jgi:hypothetical protein
MSPQTRRILLEAMHGEAFAFVKYTLITANRSLRGFVHHSS